MDELPQLEVFWASQSDSSRVKAEIVADYFGAWANIMATRPNVDQIIYLDLFAGPGFYQDGSKSTPILVLEKVIENPRVSSKLVAILNDKDKRSVERLRQAVEGLSGIANLKYQPRYLDDEVGEELTRYLEARTLAPTLLFVDPWGFKGVSQRLIGSVLRHWGCDCIFFFNYNSLNRWISVPELGHLVDEIFGEEQAKSLREQVSALGTQQREHHVMAALVESLREVKGKYILKFRFRSAGKYRTSHYLVFVSKEVLGYNIMKDIMARASSTAYEGVPSFEYDPDYDPQQVLGLQHGTIDQLATELRTAFAGRTIAIDNIYAEHNIDTNYVKSNYKEAVKQLIDNGLVTAASQSKSARRLTYSTVILFPERK